MLCETIYSYSRFKKGSHQGVLNFCVRSTPLRAASVGKSNFPQGRKSDLGQSSMHRKEDIEIKKINASGQRVKLTPVRILKMNGTH